MANWTSTLLPDQDVLPCDHTSVGMLVFRDDRLLLIERKKPPFGYAPPAGHVDDHGSFSKAATEELFEEVGLEAVSIKLLVEGRKNNRCRRLGGDWHYWRVYHVEAKGAVSPSRTETKRFIWSSKRELKVLAERTELYLAGKISAEDWARDPGLEPVWYEWLKALKWVD